MIADAVDVLVQISLRHEVRRGVAISNLSKDLKNGEVFFEPVFRYFEESLETEPFWEKLGEMKKLGKTL